MTGFGHWDYAESFTGREVAHLIAGFDPSLPNQETENKIRPIVTRMKKAYYLTLRTMIEEIKEGSGFFADAEKEQFFRTNPIKGRKSNGNSLWSCELEDLVKEYNDSYAAAEVPEDFHFSIYDQHKFSADQLLILSNKYLQPEFEKEKEEWERIEFSLSMPLFTWASEYIHEFDDQKFSRHEVHRWITENKLSSHYRFMQSDASLNISTKDISTNERNTLLLLIGALCNRVGIDPASRGAAGEVVQLARALNVDIDPDTVRSKLKDVPDAISTRRR